MDYYKILGLNSSASFEEIKLAYRKLAKKYHPDRNQENPEAEEQFKLITEAYNILSNSARKAMYDFSTSFGQLNQPWINSYTYTETSDDKAPFGKTERKERRHPFQPISERELRRKRVFRFLSIASIVIVVGLIAYGLVNFSSNYYYTSGVKHYEDKQYISALHRLDQSLQLFGTSNPKAYLLAGKILVNQNKDYKKALHYIDKGLSSAHNDLTKAELHYLKGKCLKHFNKYRSAYTNFKIAAVLNLGLDSLYYELGELNCFIFKNYEAAIKNFSTLIKLNPEYQEAYLGRGYSFQKMDEHVKAVTDFKQYLKTNEENGTAYYLKAVSEIALDRQRTACEDLEKANVYGSDRAEDLLNKTCN